MSVKGFFFILVFFLVAIMGFLIYISETVVVKYLYIAEALMLLLMLYLILFYRKIVKPMNTIGSGMELLREQDFSSRLSHVGQQEADRVVNVFNRMMEQLKNERLRFREQNHFLDLMIQYIDRGLRFYDKVTDQCSHRHQYPPVGSGCHDLTEVITGRHKAHICTGQVQ